MSQSRSTHGFKSLQKPDEKGILGKPEERATEKICGGCQHWKPFQSSYQGAGKGRCLRNPPVLNPHNNSGAGEDPACWMWPVCLVSHTCGAWTLREGTAPVERAYDQGAFA